MHTGGWIGAVGGMYNTDVVVSGGYDDQLVFYKVSPQNNKIEKNFTVRCVYSSDSRKASSTIFSSTETVSIWLS